MKKLILFSFLFALAANTIAQNKTEGVKWYTIEQAYALAQQNPKPIFVDVYTDWCGWCKKMDANTFSNPVIAEILNKNYYPVKFNAEQKDSVRILDNTFKFVGEGRQGYHELAVALLQSKMSYPTVVFLDANFGMIQPIPGYMEAKDFEPIVTFFGLEDFKSQDWETFQKEFKSKL